MIKPTVGRQVWYRPFGHNRTLLQVWDDAQPCAATVVYVWSDRCVSLQVIGPNGTVQFFSSVTLIQEGDGVPIMQHGGYAEWMPFQKGQAAKTETLSTQSTLPTIDASLLTAAAQRTGNSIDWAARIGVGTNDLRPIDVHQTLAAKPFNPEDFYNK